MVDYLTNIPNPSSITESFNKAQIRTPFEDGSVQSRVKHTRGRGMWELSYTEIFIEDAYAIRDFFYANQGDTFNWTHPVSGVVYEVRFSDDEISVEISSPRDCSMSFKIEEV